MLQLIRRLLEKPEPKEPINVWIRPSGSTWTEPCHICGEYPFWEPHQIYVKPICEGCFWDHDDHIEIALGNSPTLPSS